MRDVQAPERYRIVDRAALCELVGIAEAELAAVQNEWIESKLARGELEREPQWSEAVAVVRRSFAERVQEELGPQARYRRVADADGVSILGDAGEAYGAHFGIEMAGPSETSPLDTGKLRINSSC